MTQRRLSVAFIGAGSTVFARVLIRDLLDLTDLAPLEIRLMDIDAERLQVTAAITEQMVEHVANDMAGAEEVRDTRIVTTTERRQALDGVDYVVCLVQIGGFRPATVNDFEIPKRYGLEQTIADTLGIGGIMRGLRTIPFLQELARDMRELCPEAWLFNYANPLSINQWALEDAGVKTVGLCHGIRRTARQLAGYVGAPSDQLEYQAAGINHMAFFLGLSAGGTDLYPALRELVRDGRVPAEDRVRFEMLRHFGYFVSESSFHFAEYVPYFFRSDRPGSSERYDVPVDEYLRRCEQYEQQFSALQDAVEQTAAGTHTERIDADLVRPSDEDVAGIIHSLETGKVRSIHANVRNAGSITNLPDDCVAEVPCQIDRFGVHPLRMGLIPSHLAGLMQTNIDVQRLTVQAANTGDPNTVKRAAMLDPRTAATLTLDEIAALVDELLDAHAQWLPQFATGSGSRRAARLS